MLDREVLIACGAAAFTMAAVCRLAWGTGETFASVPKIAELACRSPRSCERDLELLVKRGYLSRRSREVRRTPTYLVPRRFYNGDRKFFLFPRWAARYIARFSERSVFAALVSRDSLNEVITGAEPYQDDSGPTDDYGRLTYPGADLARDTGISRQSVIVAIRGLVESGLVLKDDGGRSFDGRMIGDALYLNYRFEVETDLIEPRQKVAESPCKILSDPAVPPSQILSANAPDSDGCHSQILSANAPDSDGCSDRESLNKSPEGFSKSTAEPAASAAVSEAPAPEKDWQAVEGELRDLGVSAAAEAARQARNRMSVGEARTIIAEFRAKPGAWGSGALYKRFTGALSAWPPVSREYERQQADAAALRQQAERRADHDRRRLDRSVIQSRYQKLLERYGDALEAMDDSELRALFDWTFGADRAAIEWGMYIRAGKLSTSQGSELLHGMTLREPIAVA